MKIITHRDIQNLNILPHQCVNWVKEVFENKKDCLLPPKISLKQSGNIFFNTMPSIITHENCFGVKIVSRYPARKPVLDSQICLYNLTSGVLQAIMDGNWITTMRTGAVSALAVKVFAKVDFQNIGMIGLGNTARSSLLCLLSLFPQRELRISLKEYKDQAPLFAAEFSHHKNVSFSIIDDNKDLVESSDVIISCVTACDDLIGEDNWYKQGVLVVPVHTRGFQNCDLFFDKVFADDTDHVSNFKYYNKFRNFSEISEVLLGTSKGREDDEERILSYNIGISLHDIYFASKIFELFDGGYEVNLYPPSQKFWIK